MLTGNTLIETVQVFSLHKNQESESWVIISMKPLAVINAYGAVLRELNLVLMLTCWI